MKLLCWSLLLALGACGEPDAPRVPPDAGRIYKTKTEVWVRVRQDLPVASACYGGRLLYCVVDRAFLNEVIHEDLDMWFDGRMPNNERWIEEHIQRTRRSYTEAMKTRGVGLVEARVRENWRYPRVVLEGHRADLFLMVPPGKLSTKKGQWVMQSPKVAHGELKSKELAKQIDKYREMYKGKKVIRLVVDIPTAGGSALKRWDVRYFRKQGQIVVFDPKQREVAFSTPAGVSLTPYLNGKRSLSLADLRACPVTTYGELPDCSKTVGNPHRNKPGKAKAEARAR